eukprot:GHUV01007937.1.p1 GENE.GHUV01007937.1~~GHUV01007937.1.p1  ORF type:complete len:325 (+),score=104.05 GHUV01007937.1:809-1783(+)
MQTVSSAAAGSQMRSTIRPFTAHNSSALLRAAAPRRHAGSSVAASASFVSNTSSCYSVSFAASCRRVSIQSTGASRCRRTRRLIVQANWGAPVEFTTAKINSNVKGAEMLHRVVIDVGDLAAGYTKGGQFMQIKVGDGKPGFFAIASPPDPNNQGLLEFLIKAQGEAATALAALPAGAEVSVSPVMGKGFPVDKIPADNHPTVLLFATGSGISPIKALIESGDLEADKRSDVRLYYGTRDAAHTAYADCIPSWENAGVKVIQVFSDGADEGSKYVQEVFSSGMGLNGDSNGVGVVLCGHKDMCNAVKDLVAAQGVDAGKVLLNF